MRIPFTSDQQQNVAAEPTVEVEEIRGEFSALFTEAEERRARYRLHALQRLRVVRRHVQRAAGTRAEGPAQRTDRAKIPRNVGPGSNCQNSVQQVVSPGSRGQNWGFVDVSGADHVRNDIGALNERWVEAMRRNPTLRERLYGMLPTAT